MNRLKDETSPYLLQHADNPVDWWPWGEAAFAAARKADKPVLLSVGYAACHWCHVMAHESFESEEIAAIQNKYFVSIKVDREERPDVDAIYQRALQLMGEQGGWPLTMFLTPDGTPFWGGTYFPSEPKYGRPGFGDVLERVASIYANDKDSVEHNRKALEAELSRMGQATGGDWPGAEIEALLERLPGVMDGENGSFPGAPKFPQCPVLALLWRHGAAVRDTAAQKAVLRTLAAIANRGLRDHAGGGFYRYAVDAQWHIPHFEKMLYDNALLIPLMAQAWAVTNDALYREAAEEAVAWLVREMKTEGGMLASALDADSEGEEGLFYLWQRGEIESLLGKKAAQRFCDIFHVTEDGNFEGRNHLYRRDNRPDADVRDALDVLFAAREKRARPARDDKVLADWNGLAIAGLAEAGVIFGKTDWIEEAGKLFAALCDHMESTDHRLLHSRRAGRAGPAGQAADYAAMGLAAIALYEAGRGRDYLDRARTWFRILEEDFLSPDGLFYMTAEGGTDTFTRVLAIDDGPVPSANALAHDLAARLFYLTGERAYENRLMRLQEGIAGELRKAPLGHAGMIAGHILAERARQIVILGTATGKAAKAALAAAHRHGGPLRVVQCIGDAGVLPAGHPAHGKPGKPGTVFVCEGQACSRPLAGAGDLAHYLQDRVPDISH